MNIALVFETLLAFILIYIPGLNSGLQLGMLHPLMFLCPMPFVLFRGVITTKATKAAALVDFLDPGPRVTRNLGS